MLPLAVACVTLSAEWELDLKISTGQPIRISHWITKPFPFINDVVHIVAAIRHWMLNEIPIYPAKCPDVSNSAA